MPVSSKAQFRLMKAAETGDVKLPGLSPSKATEMTAGQSPVGLPERTTGLTKRAKTRRRKEYRFR
jgi:hypothetical protein